MNLFKNLKALTLATVTGVAAVATSMGAHAGPGIVSYDLGALDTLVALGQKEQVLAVPKSGLPDYLGEVAAGLPDGGSLKVPDMETLKKLKPDLVLVTGRQGESLEELKTITQVKNVGLAQGPFRESLEAKVMDLAALYGVEQEARRQLDALWRHVQEQRQALPEGVRVVVLSHNAGKFSLRQEAVVSELLGLQQPAIPDSVKPVKRGTRVFYPMSPESLVEMDPDLVLVVDRSAAIGQEPMPEGTLSRALAAAGGEDIQVKGLNPALWYLSGAGLESTRLQVDEVAEAVVTSSGNRD